MSRWAYLWQALGIALLWLLFIHVHTDITAVQIKLEMLDAAGRLLPEYKKW